MQKISPNPPAELRNPNWLHGLDRLIDRTLRIYKSARKSAQKSVHKALAKTA